MKEIKLEASKADRGAFIKFDSEKQAEIRIVVDGSQYKKVQELNELNYGDTFEITVKIGKAKGGFPEPQMQP